MPRSGDTPGSPTQLPKVDPVTGKTPTTSTPITGTNTSWHIVVLWFLGAVALIALADPAPQVATMIAVLLILGTLLNNWPTYKAYLGLK